MTIAVVDYGTGNLRSVIRATQAAAQRLGIDPDRIVRATEPEQVRSAHRVIFPGQGAMPDCMAGLLRSGLREALEESLRSKPFLGVCVGEQMLLESSEEGDTPGLGLFSGRVVRFPNDAGLKVPHMGWNRVTWTRSHPVMKGLHAPSDRWFYFVHSYYPRLQNPHESLAESDYGLTFTCALARDNIVATQFHPEKSAASGLALIENFLSWTP
ncbi:MAG: imidazole glycerol phosphate synthase subunit HisH [Burkholderiaceae bacterium]